MKARIFYIGIFLISVVGLFVVQYQYLRIGLNLAKIQFEQKLENTSKDLKDIFGNQNELSFLIAQSYNNKGYFSLSEDSLKEASRYYIYDIIEDRLKSNKVTTDFSFELYSKDSLIKLKSPASFKNDENLIKYPIALEGYLPDKLNRGLVLELQFRDLNSYFLSQLNGLLIPGLIFLAIIIFVMIWMLRLFFWQRDLITITNDFINNLTHELKTPVFSIGVATKILEKDSSEKQKPIIAEIRKQISRLNNHIEQVLGLASLESKNLMQLKKLDLKPYLEEWCENFKRLSEIENFEFNYDLEPGNYMVKAAPFYFENAISNLLDNAKKYSQDPQIHLKACKKENKLKIEIRDNGKGISKKERKNIFKKYYRISEGDLHPSKGYGLGLSYVQQIVKRHHGKIRVESEINKGTKITILIPLDG
ncbi:HAMP domain-containing sensor histidine kinase [Christiangramia sp. SM2212]|uniref:histidine kinase n=1 Tax=Christiangramia sediminicola TaxID=3073267 RepID=A0ABU1EMJ8_9FLAO|nr:HAMP domain-containing sensor histidine kinase [Christiangramia sp. SM2212]MDR5589608.1 HAMP domain-containing sensor histidine kinase [Christiangramia sp. SM2212]